MERETETETERQSAIKRQREREEPFSGSVSRVPLRFGSGAVRFCAVRLLRFRFGSTAFLFIGLKGFRAYRVQGLGLLMEPGP